MYSTELQSGLAKVNLQHYEHLGVWLLCSFQKQKLWLFDSLFPFLKFQLRNCINLTNYD